MLYRTDEEWKLMPLIAKYHQHGKDHEQPVIDESELRAHEEMGHITELTFEEAEYDAETVERLAEVKGYSESEFATVEEYVFNNKVVEGSNLALRKRNELLEESILQLSSLLVGGM